MLKDVLCFICGDIMVVFDVDYLLWLGLLKEFVVLFFDLEVGVVMGCVVL